MIDYKKKYLKYKRKYLKLSGGRPCGFPDMLRQELIKHITVPSTSLPGTSLHPNCGIAELSGGNIFGIAAAQLHDEINTSMIPKMYTYLLNLQTKVKSQLEYMKKIVPAEYKFQQENLDEFDEQIKELIDSLNPTNGNIDKIKEKIASIADNVSDLDYKMIIPGCWEYGYTLSTPPQGVLFILSRFQVNSGEGLDFSVGHLITLLARITNSGGPKSVRIIRELEIILFFQPADPKTPKRINRYIIQNLYYYLHRANNICVYETDDLREFPKKYEWVNYFRARCSDLTSVTSNAAAILNSDRAAIALSQSNPAAAIDWIVDNATAANPVAASAAAALVAAANAAANPVAASAAAAVVAAANAAAIGALNPYVAAVARYASAAAIAAANAVLVGLTPGANNNVNANAATAAAAAIEAANNAVEAGYDAVAAAAVAAAASAAGISDSVARYATTAGATAAANAADAADAVAAAAAAAAAATNATVDAAAVDASVSDSVAIAVVTSAYAATTATYAVLKGHDSADVTTSVIAAKDTFHVIAAGVVAGVDPNTVAKNAFFAATAAKPDIFPATAAVVAATGALNPYAAAVARHASAAAIAAVNVVLVGLTPGTNNNVNGNSTTAAAAIEAATNAEEAGYDAVAAAAVAAAASAAGISASAADISDSVARYATTAGATAANAAAADAGAAAAAATNAAVDTAKAAGVHPNTTIAFVTTAFAATTATYAVLKGHDSAADVTTSVIAAKNTFPDIAAGVNAGVDPNTVAKNAFFAAKNAVPDIVAVAAAAAAPDPATAATATAAAAYAADNVSLNSVDAAAAVFNLATEDKSSALVTDDNHRLIFPREMVPDVDVTVATAAGGSLPPDTEKFANLYTPGAQKGGSQAEIFEFNENNTFDNYEEFEAAENNEPLSDYSQDPDVGDSMDPKKNISPTATPFLCKNSKDDIDTKILEVLTELNDNANERLSTLAPQYTDFISTLKDAGLYKTLTKDFFEDNETGEINYKKRNKQYKKMLSFISTKLGVFFQIFDQNIHDKDYFKPKLKKIFNELKSGIIGGVRSKSKSDSEPGPKKVKPPQSVVNYKGKKKETIKQKEEKRIKKEKEEEKKEKKEKKETALEKLDDTYLDDILKLIINCLINKKKEVALKTVFNVLCALKYYRREDEKIWQTLKRFIDDIQEKMQIQLESIPGYQLNLVDKQSLDFLSVVAQYVIENVSIDSIIQGWYLYIMYEYHGFTDGIISVAGYPLAAAATAGLPSSGYPPAAANTTVVAAAAPAAAAAGIKLTFNSLIIILNDELNDSIRFTKMKIGNWRDILENLDMPNGSLHTHHSLPNKYNTVKAGISAIANVNVKL